MRGFDEAFLVAHQAKMAALRSDSARSAANCSGAIEFTLPHATILLNTLLRMHWAKRRQYQRALSSEIASLTFDHLGGAPFQRAKVAITRYSLQVPDADGLTGGMKPAIDCLLVRSTRHPEGLGFLVDDSPAHMVLIVKSARVKKQIEQRTEVRIEAL